jgi:Fe2+ transport system protein FeoA
MLEKMKISKLKKGEKGIIKNLEDSPLKQRLIEMGLTPGSVFQIRSISPFGDPIAIRLKDFSISLRLKDASLIEVERHESGYKIPA